jgi:hypothetical protein
MSAKFKSASEVTEYLKRRANAAYYTSNVADQKRAYSSTYTTFLGANVSAQGTRKMVGCNPGSSVDNKTCCPNTNGFQQRPEKVAPGFNKWNPT